MSKWAAKKPDASRRTGTLSKYCSLFKLISCFRKHKNMSIEKTKYGKYPFYPSVAITKYDLFRDPNSKALRPNQWACAHPDRLRATPSQTSARMRTNSPIAQLSLARKPKTQTRLYLVIERKRSFWIQTCPLKIILWRIGGRKRLHSETALPAAAKNRSRFHFTKPANKRAWKPTNPIKRTSKLARWNDPYTLI